MNKEIIAQQKLERDLLLGQPYVERLGLAASRKHIESNLIKLVTGPRRAGKSVFCLLLLKDRNFAYVNFDDEAFGKTFDYDRMLEAVFEVYGKTQYLFFDEIQNLKGWESFANKLYRRGFNLIITGSNASLLSKELASSLTGRYLATEVLPFSFREFLTAKGFTSTDKGFVLPETKGSVLSYLSSYLDEGGFPEIASGKAPLKDYLSTLFDAILFKDVVKRYNIRFPQSMYDLAIYLLSSPATEFTFSRIKSLLGFRSTATAQKYINFLNEAYLFFYLTRFSYKVREQINAPKKAYVVDAGLIAAKSPQVLQFKARLMENAVFLELIRRGYAANRDLFYYKTRNGKEVDFLLRQGSGFKELIQVCFDLNAAGSTAEREFRALAEAGKEFKCANLTVISWDEERSAKHNGCTIRIVPFWKWLLTAPPDGQTIK